MTKPGNAGAFVKNERGAKNPLSHCYGTEPPIATRAVKARANARPASLFLIFLNGQLRLGRKTG